MKERNQLLDEVSGGGKFVVEGDRDDQFEMEDGG
jgi:hypothetical protein